MRNFIAPFLAVAVVVTGTLLGRWHTAKRLEKPKWVQTNMAHGIEAGPGVQLYTNAYTPFTSNSILIISGSTATWTNIVISGPTKWEMLKEFWKAPLFKK